ncbi:MAG: cytochrome c1 [Tepidamorphaceae bacterium]
MTAKARPDGPNYIHSAKLTGYEEDSADVEMREGMYYESCFPAAWHRNGRRRKKSWNIPTVQRLDDGRAVCVHDVVSFLMWTAEPKLEERKRMGLQVMIFLIVSACSTSPSRSSGATSITDQAIVSARIINGRCMMRRPFSFECLKDFA